MAKVTVTPDTFSLVFFDHDTIQRLVEEVADAVGIASDAEVVVNVNEAVPLGRVQITSLEPITLSVEGGAYENAKAPRHLSDSNVKDVTSRFLFRAKDRLSAGFADAPADSELTLQQAVAWDTYAVGRAFRLGLAGQKPRRVYHFRNRHGFSDVADAVFDRLWNADSLSWSDIEAACKETEAARAAV